MREYFLLFSVFLLKNHMQGRHNNTAAVEKRTQLRLQLVIFLFPLLIYSNTIGHDYALDDAMVITQNEFTQKGWRGLKEIFSEDSFAGFFHDKKVDLPGGRYRPLSIATFAVEHAWFGSKPHLSHLINILLYAFTGIILYRALRLLFREKSGSTVWTSIPVVATFIFLSHPIHTEVVANIKGRDEILSLLFALLALISVLKYADTGHWTRLLTGFCFVGLALLSKENAVTFTVIIPLSVFFFRNVPVRQILISSVPAIAAAFLFIVIRNAITGGFAMTNAGELMNNPFLYATMNQKYATIGLTLGIYLKLLFWPHPLTFDYYPYHIGLTGWWHADVIAILIIYLVLMIYALANSRGKKPVAYSILFFLVALLPVSNLFINMGTFMNERFAYQASVAFATGVSCILIHLIDKVPVRWIHARNSFRAVILLFLILPFSAVTFARNYAWKNDYTLFMTDIKTSSGSAKCNCAAGGVLLDKAMASKNESTRKEYLRQSIRYLTRATVIDPTYSDVWRKLGTAEYELNHNVTNAFHDYYGAIRINPGDEMAYSNIHFILSKYDSIDQKINMYEKLLKINPKRPDIQAELGMLYGRYKKDYPVSIEYFKEAVRLNPDYKEAYKGLGVACQMSGDYGESMYWFEQALQLDTLDASIYKLMGNSMLKMGKEKEAVLLFSKSDRLKTGTR
jgi:Tfp pilus assembly protein PilF